MIFCHYTTTPTDRRRMLQRLRRQSGLTRRALAEKSGYHWRTVEEVERTGRTQVQTLVDLLSALGYELVAMRRRDG